MQCTRCIEIRHFVNVAKRARDQCSILVWFKNLPWLWAFIGVTHSYSSRSFLCTLVTTSSNTTLNPLFCTLLWGKGREGAFAWIFNSPHTCAPSLRLSQITQGQQSWWLPWLSRRIAALLNVYYKKSVELVLILSQEASNHFIVSGDRRWPCVSSRS